MGAWSLWLIFSRASPRLLGGKKKGKKGKCRGKRNKITIPNFLFPPEIVPSWASFISRFLCSKISASSLPPGQKHCTRPGTASSTQTLAGSSNTDLCFLQDYSPVQHWAEHPQLYVCGWHKTASVYNSSFTSPCDIETTFWKIAEGLKCTWWRPSTGPTARSCALWLFAKVFFCSIFPLQFNKIPSYIKKPITILKNWLYVDNQL